MQTRPEQGGAPLLLIERPALDLEQLDRFGVSGEMRFGIENARNLFCVSFPIGAEFLHNVSLCSGAISAKRFAYPDRSRQHQSIDALGMLDGERLRDQAAERRAVYVRFLDAEGLDQRGSIVTHILERIGLPGLPRFSGIALIVSDDREALFKLGGERRKHRMVGFSPVHQHNRRTGARPRVGDGCAVGLQPTHGGFFPSTGFDLRRVAITCR